MAKKKKPKKDKTKKKRSKRRRGATARMNKKRELASRRGPASHRGKELVKDMSPLFSQFGDGPMQTDAAEERLIMTVLESDDLADEPELQEIMIDPMLCTDTFAQVGEEMGIDPRKFDRLSEEKRGKIQVQMVEECTQRLLREDLRQDILKGLDGVRLRLKRSGEHREAARVATVQWLLSMEGFRATWPMVGVLQAVFNRSLMAGFEINKVTLELMESGELKCLSPLQQMERLDQSDLGQKTDALFEKMPGLEGFMRKETDKIWYEGIEAVFKGELQLGLYRKEEILGAFNILNALVGYTGAANETHIDPSSMKMSQEISDTFVTQLDGYITKLFTPERLDRLRKLLDTKLENPAEMGTWSSFIMLCLENMKRENAVRNEKIFLVSALLGEMRAVAEKSAQP
jgi:hypothetical protein